MLLVSFNGRECRREKLAKLIEENFEDGEWFTVHDVTYLWSKRWNHDLATRELAKVLPILPLESEKRPGYSYKFYRNPGIHPLYVRRKRPYYDDE